MYGIFTYIGVIFRANVGKYSIHGAYGYVYIFTVEESYLIYAHRASTYNSRIVGIVFVCIDTHALLCIYIYTHCAVAQMCIYIYIIYIHLFTHM